jgi:hypothetical protein
MASLLHGDQPPQKDDDTNSVTPTSGFENLMASTLLRSCRDSPAWICISHEQRDVGALNPQAQVIAVLSPSNGNTVDNWGLVIFFSLGSRQHTATVEGPRSLQSSNHPFTHPRPAQTVQTTLQMMTLRLTRTHHAAATKPRQMPQPLAPVTWKASLSWLMSLWMCACGSRFLMVCVMVWASW